MASEKRLIDANAVEYENIMCSQSQLHWLNAIIEKQPTIDPVHAAGGCYCRECRYLQKDTHGLWCFRDYENPLKLDGFCSYGAKMDGGVSDG